LMNIPEVVVYRTYEWQVRLRPYVLKVPFVSLVNLNLGREAVREIIQSTLDVTEAEAELRAILAGGAKREKMLVDFDELRVVIGNAGASERFALRMVEEIQNSKFKIQN
ncbi:MAG: lipid-A-disaccharide synthase, partial [Alistipes sp.]|nr:lipid-A-disaccharide synthase [Alistipes sp.]